MPFKFRFRWIPFIAALIVAAVGITLGNWQTRRAQEKQEIEAKLGVRQHAPALVLEGRGDVPADIEYRRVAVRGEFVPGWTFYLDNRPYNGVPGFYVLTPLKIAGSDMHVLVSRGWLKRDVADRTRIPPIATPKGTIEISGIVRNSSSRLLQLGEAPPLQPNAIVQNAEAQDVGRAAGLPIHPFVIEQLTDVHDGLVRDWPRPSTGEDRHRGYAFQWYALAATALIFFVVTGFRRGTN
ncbi:SURF1 family protein [Noviherbaspirillum sp. Root189]|uniref:SURF1 family protein n=1 Tax=Noviherbaspirillum sp. Root189 TaxID=1736487 RepID=UPI000710AD36|nr:SURF1 family protein [Noviherbaspirillum sp. Root189]KRB92249.1 cytochrome oxidase biosynthesis protein [Noviherbaspirillum sp. Root189]